MSFFPVFEYGFFDYSLTSPHYFLVRLGCVLLMLYAAYKWSTRPGARNWSPLIVLGQASLLVYWIHVELVYGRPLHSFARALDFAAAARHLLWMIPLMVVLAEARRLSKLRQGRWVSDWLFAREVLANVRRRLAVDQGSIPEQSDPMVISSGNDGSR